MDSRALADTRAVEHRGDRAYDDQDASTLIVPPWSLCCSYDRPFLAAATREVLALHDATDEEAGT